MNNKPNKIKLILLKYSYLNSQPNNKNYLNKITPRNSNKIRY